MWSKDIFKSHGGVLDIATVCPFFDKDERNVCGLALSNKESPSTDLLMIVWVIRLPNLPPSFNGGYA